MVLIVSLLVPHRRKIIGYLWAIQNGATEIYEIDDADVLEVDSIPSLSQLKFYTYNTTGEHLATFGWQGTKLLTFFCCYLYPVQ